MGEQADTKTAPRKSAQWKSVVSWVVATTLFVLVIAVLHATTGFGGLATGVGAALLAMWFFALHKNRGRRRQLWAAVWAFSAVTLVWDGITFVDYVTTYNGDSTTQKMSTWGRDHGLSPIIDYLEKEAYSKPPSTKPADELSLGLPSTTSTTTPATDSTTTDPNAETTTTLPQPEPPAPLATYIQPALAGEGQWVPIAKVAGVDAVWVTSLRPLAKYGSVVATVVVLDPTNMRIGMFNGRELPGGNWVRDDHVPETIQPALVAAMNGAFRLEHLYGGYMTEGKVVKPLENRMGTIGITRDGKLVLGELGRDMMDDGSWQSLRQNGLLMVDGGLSQVDRARAERVSWGAAGTGDLFVNRSAVCTMTNGRIAYVMAGMVDPTQMAQVLIEAGCDKAVQLHINNQWPNFMVFTHAADGTINGFTVDRRMRNDPGRYLKVSSKEFFAYFDSTLLPATSDLDA